MDEYDRWYRGYQAKRRFARDAKFAAYIVIGTLAVVGLINVITGIMS